jgi:hypothetical protein
MINHDAGTLDNLANHTRIRAFNQLGAALRTALNSFRRVGVTFLNHTVLKYPGFDQKKEIPP